MATDPPSPPTPPEQQPQPSPFAAFWYLLVPVLAFVGGIVAAVVGMMVNDDGSREGGLRNLDIHFILGGLVGGVLGLVIARAARR